jgi:putative oxidoreductase
MIASLIARVCLVALFPVSAVDKVVHWNEAKQQAASSSFMPGPKLLVLAIIVEILAPLCLVTGWHDRLAAFVLAAFCLVTAFLYHPFWKYPNYWAQGGEGRSHFWDFLKNFGLIGGLLFIAIGSGSTTPHHAIAQPSVSESSTIPSPSMLLSSCLEPDAAAALLPSQRRRQ